jgi:VWFA-related protein
MPAAFMLVCAALPFAAGQKAAPRPPAAFVELDAVVVDDHGQPVRGLRQEEFQIKEDGRAVAVTSFKEVSAAGIASQGDRRWLVLLLDDTGVGASGTIIVQSIARLFVSRARPADAVAVVRLTHQEDEAVGPPQIALAKIDDYRARSVPYFGRETIEESLKALTRVSMQLEPIEHRRKAVVCIGRRSLCDLYLEAPQTSLLWPAWKDALMATARANVSLYVVDPAGVTGQVDLGLGLVDLTGGTDFVRSNNFERAAELIWDEASHYYLFGYAPTARARALHTIDVKVRRSGLHVRARHQRGD